MNQETTTDAQTTPTPVPSDKLAIHFYTDKALSTPCEPVKEIDDALIELAGKMLATMRLNGGVGLSVTK